MLRSIQVADRSILFSPDDPVPLASRLQALLKMRLLDELTGSPPDSEITIQVRERGFVPRVAKDGLAGLVGIPRHLFPALNTQDYVLHLSVKADGYVSRHIELKVPQDPSFPATFTPQQLNLILHREPIVIAGRTVRQVANGSTPLGGTQITLTGIWRTAPPANVVVAPDPPNMVSLQPPLYSDRPAVTQFLRPRDLPPIAGNDKLLLDDALPGANSIRLSDRQGLVAGDILLIDAQEPDLAELIAINTLPVTSPADQPTFITLDYPLLQRHRRSAVVRQTAPQPAGAARQFTVDAIGGDTSVFLNGLIGLTGASEVQISGPPGPDENHKVMNFSVTSDAAGYYRLPPLSRVAQLEIHAEVNVGIQLFKTTTTFRPDYRQRDNRLDLTLAA